MIEFTVDGRTMGQRPDRALRIMAPGLDREGALRALRGERILVNGAPATLRTVLAAGDVVKAKVDARLQHQRPVSPGQATGLGFSLLHLDAHLCVVDKPAGVSVHPAPGVVESDTMVDRVAALLEDRGITPARPPLVAGRLDRGTSGVLILTLSRPAERALAHAFEEDAVEKIYLALCHGVTSERFDVDAPLTVSRYRRGQAKEKKVKEAVTHCERLAHSRTASLLRVVPETGRMHQIRRHLRAVNHPIIGDGKYGFREDRGSDIFCLHAWHVAFEHPVEKRRLRFTAALPEHFRERLREHGLEAALKVHGLGR